MEMLGGVANFVLEYNIAQQYSPILAILDPSFVSDEEANKQYSQDELVLGLSIDGDHRAYSIPHLSWYEVVNDVVEGVPVAVTW